MYYLLFTKILQGRNASSGNVFTKGVLEFVVKILDKYTYKEFLNLPFTIEIVNLRKLASKN